MPKKYRSIGEYLILSTIGHGSSGRVKLGIHQTTGHKVAIKIIPRSQLAVSLKIAQAVERELAILQLLGHENLIELYAVLQDSKNVYFVTEYAAGGELYHILKKKGRLEEEDARNIFGQIASALSWCHARNICHRDLKPENILLDDKRKNIKIADFGMATIQSKDALLLTSCGSPHYASPEIIKGIPYFGPSADVWSAGVILYTLLSGNLPFDHHNIGKLLAKIKTGRFSKLPDWVSPSAKDLIYRILVVDPNQRITANDILSHPWMVPFTLLTQTTENSIHSFSLQFNPWHDDTLKQPVISNSGGLDGPIRETLKVLWRNLTNDQIVFALMQKKPNPQKLAYQLLVSRQKRQYLAKRSTEFIEASTICDTVESSPFCNNVTTAGDSNSNNNKLSSSDTTMDKLSYAAPQMEPNTTRTSSFTTTSFIYPPSIQSSLTCYSQQQPIPFLNITSSKATIHSIMNTHTLPCFTIDTTRNNLDTRLHSFLQGGKGTDVSCMQTLTHITTYIKGYIQSAWKNCTYFGFKQPPSKRITRQEFSLTCIAKSEYIAAGKLHFILASHFDGKLNGCMYPDGKILWSGEIDKSACEAKGKTCFLCTIRHIQDSKSLYKLTFIIHREDVQLISLFANKLMSLLVNYEQESSIVLGANRWNKRA